MRVRVRRGDECAFDVNVTRAGAPFNLTGSHVFFFAKRGLPDPDPPVIKLSTITGGVNVINLVQGQARVILKPQDTLSLFNETKIHPFDVVVREPDGSVFTVISGELVIVASVLESGLA